MKNKGLILRIIGILFCVVPPVIATLEYFPLFKEQPETGVSALSAVFLALCAIPAWKYIKKALKSPSAWLLWLVILVFSVCFEPIVYQMKIISAISVVSSVIGAIFFRWAKKYLPVKLGEPNE